MRTVETALCILLCGAAACIPAEDDPCADVTCVDSLPASFDGDGSAPVYRVTASADGVLVARVSGAVDRVTLESDVVLDTHASAVAARVAPGEYTITVEAGGPYSIDIGLTTPQTLAALGMNPELAADALRVFGNAWAWGASRRTEYAIIDFTLHSATPREWVVDLATDELLWQLRVAHGRKSTDGVDLAHAITFSNTSGSNQSSLGLLRSAGTYVGTFGASFRLEGLEPGFNDNVCDRDIVMHPWAPMGDDYVDRCGWARPSLGCPAIDSLISQPVRDRLARPDGAALDQGVLMLFWYPGTDWQATSPYLRGEQPTPALLQQLTVECDSSQDSTPEPPESSDYRCD